MSETEAKTDIPDNAQDLTIFVQNLLEQMVFPYLISYLFINILSFLLYFCFQQQRFNQMSTSIIGRIDEMGNRIDDLEKSISDLMQQVSRRELSSNILFS